MSKHVLIVQTLQNIRGHWTIAQILTILVSLTKALFWRLGTPLLPSMLTIIQNRFLTSIAIFLNNSHLIYTSILCFCSFYCFHFASSCIYFVISHFIFIRLRLQTDSRNSFQSLKVFQSANIFIFLITQYSKIQECLQN